jgi:Tfp pilus assembly PilM family ATPase
MSSLLSVRETPTPEVAVEIAASHVSAASLGWRGRDPVVAAHALEWLPPQALVPSLTAVNAHDRRAVVAAVGRVLEKVGRPRRIGLVLPDVIAKVSLIRFEQVPARAQELEQLVRWQVRKTAPFPIEEAQISFVPGLGAADGHEFIVVVARRDVVTEYEGICTEAGAHAGLVDLSTFNVINAVLAGSGSPETDWLLVNIAADYASIAILRGPDLILFRNRAADTEGTLADLVHQTAMYYEDRLKGGGFARVVLAGAANAGPEHAADVEQLRRSLEERVATTVESIDPRAAAGITDRIAATPSLLDALAPLVGLLLRDREMSRV